MFEEIIKILTERKEKVSTMESCTGGALASEITNYKGASSILNYSAVTYSNSFKIKMGVKKDIIDKYSVYSIETAKSMAKSISDFANSNYGIGITGKLTCEDPSNPVGADDEVFIAVYDKNNNKFWEYKINISSIKTRKENKEEIVDFIGKKFLNIIK